MLTSLPRNRIIQCSAIFTMIFNLSATSLRAQEVPEGTARVWSEPSTAPPDRVVDMKHMRLEVAFDTVSGTVYGTVTHLFTPLRHEVDSIFFHGPGIDVISASLNGRPVQTQPSPGGISVLCEPALNAGENDSITFTYEARPRRGIYFVGWNDPTGRSRRQIWTQGQGIDNRHWFPCYDLQHDKLTTETLITFDSTYRVLSNGALLYVRTHSDGTRTWHYRVSHPHTTYLVMIGIGRYDVETRYTQRGVPVHLWYYPDMADRVEPTYRYSTECIDFMEEQTGIPYPWESYANLPVQDFLHGAMENTTATVFGDFSMVDRRSFLDKNFIDVNVHELAHQWFGDCVTGRSGRDAWLHESFASWYPKLFLRNIYGEDTYQWTRRTEQQRALAASEKNRYPVLHSRAGADRVYAKGSAVLDMMAWTFGDNELRRVITHYLATHAYGTVESIDLERSFQDVLGIAPHWFFDEWIYRGGEPHYEVSWRDIAAFPGRHRETVVTVRQVQQVDELSGLFRMPVAIEVHYTDGGADRRRVVLERQTEKVRLPNPGSRPIAFVLFDPGGWILKRVTFDKSFGELRSQALGAPEMIDRYDAVAAMDSLPLALKRNVLLDVYRRESFHAVRAEAARQLSRDRSQTGRAFLQRALADPSAGVRAAVLASLETVPNTLAGPVEQLLRDSSYAVVDSALGKLAASFPERLDRYLEAIRDDRGIGNHLLVRRHELAALHGSTASRDSLVDLAGPWFEFRTRINALQALRRLNECPETLIPHLFDAMTHWNARLRGPATDVASGFASQTALRGRMLRVYRAGSWQPWQHTILRSFFPLQE